MHSKLARILFAIVLFYGGVTSASPMMLCALIEEPAQPAACDDHEQQNNHCDEEGQQCPICAVSVCNEQPASVKIFEGNNGHTLLTVLAVMPFSHGASPLPTHICDDVSTTPPRYMARAPLRI